MRKKQFVGGAKNRLDRPGGEGGKEGTQSVSGPSQESPEGKEKVSSEASNGYRGPCRSSVEGRCKHAQN